ncbi:MAG: alkaline phosphatase D family protein [Bacteroidota bacterium]
MQKLPFQLLLLFVFFCNILTAQEGDPLSPQLHFGVDSLLFDPQLKPFYHGVASGDPLHTQVIIWTRVTPDSMEIEVPVSWVMATDTLMENIVATGDTTTNANRDYTVKVDVAGLAPNTTYYYLFTVGGQNSLIGRTKTAPESEDHLRFAVVSCNNYEGGYFNAFGRVASRNDLHAVIHLGDYIYEQEANVYGDTSLTSRRHQDFEAVSLDEYRARYSLYRLDSDLRKAHQQHAFINVWDDHESANDAWKGGAENHTDSTEGSWSVRKNVSRQAFFEWIPIRDTEDSLIYRRLSYGDLAELIMLDTRIAGRDKQPTSVLDSNFLDPNRSILGLDQKQWLFSSLEASEARWKIIGNQVIFSELHIGWAGPITGSTPEEAESIFLDIWDGYPLERLEIINFLADNALDNTVFLAGDFHSSFAFDIADTVVNPEAGYLPVSNYDAETGEGSVAVEFATPSISSPNFDENLDPLQAGLIEKIIIDGDSVFLSPAIPSPNPHMKYTDLDRHGYVLLDIKPDSVQANWFYVDRLNAPSNQEAFSAALFTRNGENHLVRATEESEKKEIQDDPAPARPLDNTVSNQDRLEQIALFSLYPNPAGESLNVMYGLNETARIRLEVLTIEGKLLKATGYKPKASGIYQMQLSTKALPAGMYMIKLTSGKTSQIQKFIKR